MWRSGLGALAILGLALAACDAPAGNRGQPADAGAVVDSMVDATALDSGVVVAGIPAMAMAMNCDHCAKTATWPNVAFGLLRLWDSDVNWAALELHRGMYDWSILDPTLDYIAANHLQALYTFGHVPCWATGGTCGPTSWSAAPPTKNQDCFDFVTALVGHCSANGNCVKDYIKYWEMWNEANDPTFWSGTIADLMPLVAGAAPIITNAVPGAQLTTPSSTSTGGTRASWMTSWLQAGGTQYADIMAYHVYLDGVTPEQQLSVIATMQGVAHDNGMAGKPEWDSEGGWSGSATVACPSALTTVDCVGQLARWYALQLSSGISEFTWYAWDDITPAGPAYGVVYSWLVGAAFTAPCSSDASGVWTCNLVRASPAGYQGELVWNPSATSSYAAPSAFTSYRDLTGATTAVPGDRMLTIGPEPILLE